MSRLYQIFWISLFIRLVVAAILPVTSDEAYYWVWSHHPQLSYYDHPPMISWIYWLGQAFENWGGMVRWPGVLLSQAMIWIWLEVLKPWLDDSQKILWLALMLLNPLIGGSGIIITPDVPMLFFWALSLLLFLRWSTNPYPLLSFCFGLAMGLGACSKYVMILFPLSLLPVVLQSPAWRKALRSQFLWIFVGGICGLLPVLAWNIGNDFASFRFQLDHGVGAKVWKPSWTTEYILLQILVIFPPILFFAFRGRNKTSVLWSWMAFTSLVFFFLTSFRGYVEANWPIVAYPALFVLAVVGVGKKKQIIWATAGFWAAMTALLFAVILAPKGERIKTSKLREFFQYKKVAQLVKDKEPLFARSYQMASSLSFELKKPIYKLKHMNRKDFFDFVPQSEPQDGFFVLIEKGESVPKYYRQNGFAVTSQEDYGDWSLVRMERAANP